MALGCLCGLVVLIRCGGCAEHAARIGGVAAGHAREPVAQRDPGLLLALLLDLLDRFNSEMQRDLCSAPLMFLNSDVKACPHL